MNCCSSNRKRIPIKPSLACAASKGYPVCLCVLFRTLCGCGFSVLPFCNMLDSTIFQRPDKSRHTRKNLGCSIRHKNRFLPSKIDVQGKKKMVLVRHDLCTVCIRMRSSSIFKRRCPDKMAFMFQLFLCGPCVSHTFATSLPIPLLPPVTRQCTPLTENLLIGPKSLRMRYRRASSVVPTPTSTVQPSVIASASTCPISIPRRWLLSIVPSSSSGLAGKVSTEQARELQRIEEKRCTEALCQGPAVPIDVLVGRRSLSVAGWHDRPQ